MNILFAGKRMCIGDDLARIFLFMFSVNILQTFQISLEDPDGINLSGECGITLTPPDYKLIFTAK